VANFSRIQSQQGIGPSIRAALLRPLRPHSRTKDMEDTKQHGRDVGQRTELTTIGGKV
jgi:hypothetical protein